MVAKNRTTLLRATSYYLPRAPETRVQRSSAITSDYQRLSATGALQKAGMAWMAWMARVARVAWDLEDLRGTG